MVRVRLVPRPQKIVTMTTAELIVRYTLITVFVGGTLFLIATFVLLGIALDMCATDIREERVSPGGAHKAVNYTWGCGATTANTYMISVIDADDDLGDKPRARVFAAEGAPDVRAAWENHDSLIICFDTTKTEFRPGEVDGISVVIEHTPFRTFDYDPVRGRRGSTEKSRCEFSDESLLD